LTRQASGNPSIDLATFISPEGLLETSSKQQTGFW
jgi:hypothetical protein